MTASAASSLSDHVLLSAVVEGVSGDAFLAFTDRFLDARLSAATPLLWPPADGTFTVAHLQSHTQYCLLYESRIKSTLAKLRMTQDELVDRCLRVSTSTSRDGEVTEGSSVATTAELAECLLNMLECVADFQTFAAMMAMRQRKLLGGSTSADEESDAAEGDDAAA